MSKTKPAPDEPLPARGVYVQVSDKKPFGCLRFIFVDGTILRAGYEDETEAYIDARTIRNALKERESRET